MVRPISGLIPLRNDSRFAFSTQNSIRENGVSLLLSRCNMFLWTAEIGLGTPPQYFHVKIDTASSEFLIPSLGCNGLCQHFCNDLNAFNRSQSRTYQQQSIRTDYRLRRDYNRSYNNASKGKKTSIKIDVDKLQLSYVSITDQHFAESLTKDYGTLGLGFSRGHQQSLLLENLKKSFKNPIFSLYLIRDSTQSTHYPQGKQVNLSTNTNFSHGKLFSKIIFGGVLRRYYNGCLSWHDVYSTRTTPLPLNTNKIYSGLWDIGVDGAYFDGQALHHSTFKMKNRKRRPTNFQAVVDSGSFYIVAPKDAFALIASITGAKCFRMSLHEFLNDINEVSCLEAFDDVANIGVIDGSVPNLVPVVDCSISIPRLEFKTSNTEFGNKVVYFLDKENLIMELEQYPKAQTSEGNKKNSPITHQNITYASINKNNGYKVHKFCALRVIASNRSNAASWSWTLGQPFLEKYYAAFDIEKKRIGFALARTSSNSLVMNQQVFCKDDSSIDIYFNLNTAMGKGDIVLSNGKVDNAVTNSFIVALLFTASFVLLSGICIFKKIRINDSRYIDITVCYEENNDDIAPDEKFDFSSCLQ